MRAAPRTYLFVPGDRPERFEKALASAADAVIIDLEDAVAPEAKIAARGTVLAWLGAHRGEITRVLVRINDVTTPWFEDDLAMLAQARPGGVMLPKAERAADIARVAALRPGEAFIVPLIESAAGVLRLAEVARSPGVLRLAFGTLDFAIDLDLSGDERGLAVAATLIALESRVAGLQSPVAGVTPELNDTVRLLDDLAQARAFGFGAKLCIHPAQVDPIHRALAPSAQQLDWARRVLEAARQGGAVRVDGKMVDRPVLLKAQALLDRAAADAGR